ncbi:Hypothetical protein, putative [Bodo saltans]|uniref:Uncharacterized protein n=1 Tax=Bodo saltans TaxID=75058 RepID=A0A0S4IL20_BODSA|nr:Hypothetical protein, putative [Bodo saltans]|eukprot:CUE68038.1 Hypothetical protein, putative [Bodo saltans]
MFEKVYNVLITHDKHARFSYKDCFQYRLEDTRCVVQRGSGATSGTKPVTELLLFPFTVTIRWCLHKPCEVPPYDYCDQLYTWSKV